VLAVAPTVDDLGHLQREVLIPLELQLIERGATERLTRDPVLSAAREAVDHYRSGV
jgi:hypothetical protein